MTPENNPIISLIAAMSENRVIGCNGVVPWDIPEDRRRFRELTMGHPVVMGRKTFESIGHPLPGRQTIVLTKQRGYRAEGCLVLNDLRSAFAACAGSAEVFVCGGGGIYREALPFAHRIYLTLVQGEFQGDAVFPALSDGAFQEKERQMVKGSPSCTYLVLERSGPSLPWG